MNEPGTQIQAAPQPFSPTLQEYHEVILHISGVQGQLRAQLSWRSMLESEGEGSVVDRQIYLWQADTLVRDSKVISSKLVPSPQTLSDLIECCSAQLKEVASTGQKIIATSRKLSAGVQEIQEGAGKLNRKLARVKY